MGTGKQAMVEVLVITITLLPTAAARPPTVLTLYDMLDRSTDRIKRCRCVKPS